jgi:hypothetical protein
MDEDDDGRIRVSEGNPGKILSPGDDIWFPWMTDRRPWQADIGMTLDHWRAYVEVEGWPSAQARQGEFGYPVMRMQQRVREKDDTVDLEQFYAMEVSIVEISKHRLEAPDTSDEDREWLKRQILLKQQQNSWLRQMVAIWKFKRGDFNE